MPANLDEEDDVLLFTAISLKRRVEELKQRLQNCVQNLESASNSSGPTHESSVLQKQQDGSVQNGYTQQTPHVTCNGSQGYDEPCRGMDGPIPQKGQGSDRDVVQEANVTKRNITADDDDREEPTKDVEFDSDLAFDDDNGTPGIMQQPSIPATVSLHSLDGHDGNAPSSSVPPTTAMSVGSALQSLKLNLSPHLRSSFKGENLPTHGEQLRTLHRRALNDSVNRRMLVRANTYHTSGGLECDVGDNDARDSIAQATDANKGSLRPVPGSPSSLPSQSNGVHVAHQGNSEAKKHGFTASVSFPAYSSSQQSDLNFTPSDSVRPGVNGHLVAMAKSPGSKVPAPNTLSGAPVTAAVPAKPLGWATQPGPTQELQHPAAAPLPRESDTVNPAVSGVAAKSARPLLSVDSGSSSGSRGFGWKFSPLGSGRVAVSVGSGAGEEEMPSPAGSSQTPRGDVSSPHSRPLAPAAVASPVAPGVGFVPPSHLFPNGLSNGNGQASSGPAPQAPSGGQPNNVGVVGFVPPPQAPSTSTGVVGFVPPAALGFVPQPSRLDSRSAPQSHHSADAAADATTNGAKGNNGKGTVGFRPHTGLFAAGLSGMGPRALMKSVSCNEQSLTSTATAALRADPAQMLMGPRGGADSPLPRPRGPVVPTGEFSFGIGARVFSSSKKLAFDADSADGTRAASSSGGSTAPTGGPCTELQVSQQQQLLQHPSGISYLSSELSGRGPGVRYERSSESSGGRVTSDGEGRGRVGGHKEKLPWEDSSEDEAVEPGLPDGNEANEQPAASRGGAEREQDGHPAAAGSSSVGRRPPVVKLPSGMKGECGADAGVATVADGIRAPRQRWADGVAAAAASRNEHPESSLRSGRAAVHSASHPSRAATAHESPANPHGAGGVAKWPSSQGSSIQQPASGPHDSASSPRAPASAPAVSIVLTEADVARAGGMMPALVELVRERFRQKGIQSLSDMASSGLISAQSSELSSVLSQAISGETLADRIAARVESFHATRRRGTMESLTEALSCLEVVSEPLCGGSDNGTQKAAARPHMPRSSTDFGAPPTPFSHPNVNGTFNPDLSPRASIPTTTTTATNTTITNSVTPTAQPAPADAAASATISTWLALNNSNKSTGGGSTGGRNTAPLIPKLPIPTRGPVSPPHSGPPRQSPKSPKAPLPLLAARATCPNGPAATAATNALAALDPSLTVPLTAPGYMAAAEAAAAAPSPRTERATQTEPGGVARLEAPPSAEPPLGTAQEYFLSTTASPKPKPLVGGGSLPFDGMFAATMATAADFFRSAAPLAGLNASAGEVAAAAAAAGATMRGLPASVSSPGCAAIMLRGAGGDGGPSDRVGIRDPTSLPGTPSHQAAQRPATAAAARGVLSVGGMMSRPRSRALGNGGGGRVVIDDEPVDLAAHSSGRTMPYYSRRGSMGTTTRVAFEDSGSDEPGGVVSRTVSVGVEDGNGGGGRGLTHEMLMRLASLEPPHHAFETTTDEERVVQEQLARRRARLQRRGKGEPLGSPGHRSTGTAGTSVADMQSLPQPRGKSYPGAQPAAHFPRSPRVAAVTQAGAPVPNGDAGTHTPDMHRSLEGPPPPHPHHGHTSRGAPHRLASHRLAADDPATAAAAAIGLGTDSPAIAAAPGDLIEVPPLSLDAPDLSDAGGGDGGRAGLSRAVRQLPHDSFFLSRAADWQRQGGLGGLGAVGAEREGMGRSNGRGRVPSRVSYGPVTNGSHRRRPPRSRTWSNSGSTSDSDSSSTTQGNEQRTRSASLQQRRLRSALSVSSCHGKVVERAARHRRHASCDPTISGASGRRQRVLGWEDEETPGLLPDDVPSDGYDADDTGASPDFDRLPSALSTGSRIPPSPSSAAVSVFSPQRYVAAVRAHRSVSEANSTRRQSSGPLLLTEEGSPSDAAAAAQVDGDVDEDVVGAGTGDGADLGFPDGDERGSDVEVLEALLRRSPSPDLRGGHGDGEAEGKVGKALFNGKQPSDEKGEETDGGPGGVVPDGSTSAAADNACGGLNLALESERPDEPGARASATPSAGGGDVSGTSTPVAGTRVRASLQRLLELRATATASGRQPRVNDPVVVNTGPGKASASAPMASHPSGAPGVGPVQRGRSGSPVDLQAPSFMPSAAADSACDRAVKVPSRSPSNAATVGSVVTDAGAVAGREGPVLPTRLSNDSTEAVASVGRPTQQADRRASAAAATLRVSATAPPPPSPQVQQQRKPRRHGALGTGGKRGSSGGGDGDGSDCSSDTPPEDPHALLSPHFTRDMAEEEYGSNVATGDADVDNVASPRGQWHPTAGAGGMSPWRRACRPLVPLPYDPAEVPTAGVDDICVSYTRELEQQTLQEEVSELLGLTLPSSSAVAQALEALAGAADARAPRAPPSSSSPSSPQPASGRPHRTTSPGRSSSASSPGPSEGRATNTAAPPVVSGASGGGGDDIPDWLATILGPPLETTALIQQPTTGPSAALAELLASVRPLASVAAGAGATTPTPGSGAPSISSVSVVSLHLSGTTTPPPPLPLPVGPSASSSARDEPLLSQRSSQSSRQDADALRPGSLEPDKDLQRLLLSAWSRWYLRRRAGGRSGKGGGGGSAGRSVGGRLLTPGKDAETAAAAGAVQARIQALAGVGGSQTWEGTASSPVLQAAADSSRLHMSFTRWLGLTRSSRRSSVHAPPSARSSMQGWGSEPRVSRAPSSSNTTVSAATSPGPKPLSSSSSHAAGFPHTAPTARTTAPPSASLWASRPTTNTDPSSPIALTTTAARAAAPASSSAPAPRVPPAAPVSSAWPSVLHADPSPSRQSRAPYPSVAAATTSGLPPGVGAYPSAGTSNYVVTISQPPPPPQLLPQPRLQPAAGVHEPLPAAAVAAHAATRSRSAALSTPTISRSSGVRQVMPPTDRFQSLSGQQPPLQHQQPRTSMLHHTHSLPSDSYEASTRPPTSTTTSFAGYGAPPRNSVLNPTVPTSAAPTRAMSGAATPFMTTPPPPSGPVPGSELERLVALHLLDGLEAGSEGVILAGLQLAAGTAPVGGERDRPAAGTAGPPHVMSHMASARAGSPLLQAHRNPAAAFQAGGGLGEGGGDSMGGARAGGGGARPLRPASTGRMGVVQQPQYPHPQPQLQQHSLYQPQTGLGMRGGSSNGGGGSYGGGVGLGTGSSPGGNNSILGRQLLGGAAQERHQASPRWVPSSDSTVPGSSVLARVSSSPRTTGGSSAGGGVAAAAGGFGRGVSLRPPSPMGSRGPTTNNIRPPVLGSGEVNWAFYGLGPEK